MTTLMSCSISSTPIFFYVTDPDEQLVQLARFARIEAGGRFVQAEQDRLGTHGAGDFQPALGTIGQVAGRLSRRIW